MIYKILIDNNTSASTIDQNYLYYSGDPEYTLDDIDLDLKVDEAGELRFVIYSNHPNFSLIKTGTSHVYMYRDSDLIFDGFISEIVRNIYNALTVYCTGILGILNFTIQPQLEYQGTPSGYLEELLDNHNEYQNLVTNPHFNVYMGTCDIDDEYILRYANYEQTLDVIRRDLMESFDVYPKITYNSTHGKWPVLNLYPIGSYGNLSTQTIEMGENILEYAENEAIDNLYTAVIPLGKQKEENERVPADIAALDAYVNINPVNNYVPYLINATAAAQYGVKMAVVQWEGVTIPKNLKTKGQAWLDAAQFETLRLELTAIDLSMLGNNFDAFKLGDRVHVKATPLNIDLTLPVYEMTIYPLKPDDNKLVLGADAPSLVGRPVSEAGVRYDAESYTLADWNTDFDLQGVQFDGFVSEIGPNYWNTDKAIKEPVTICNDYTYVYPAGAELTTTHNLDLTIPPLLSQENLCFDVAQVVFYANNSTNHTMAVKLVSPLSSEQIVSHIVGGARSVAEFDTNTGFGILMPQSGSYFQLQTATPMGTRREMTVRFNSITGIRQRAVFPWFVSGYDLNDDYQDGGSMVITDNGVRYLTMTGKRSLRGTFIWPDQSSHPNNLSVKFTVKREIPTGTDMQIVDQSGNNLSAGNSNVLGWTYGTMTDADEVLTVKFGNVTHILTAGELDEAPQEITLDLSGDTANASAYAGHFMKQIIFYVNAPYRIFLTDIHVNGDIKYWTDNPYNELIAF